MKLKGQVQSQSFNRHHLSHCQVQSQVQFHCQTLSEIIDDWSCYQIPVDMTLMHHNKPNILVGKVRPTSGHWTRFWRYCRRFGL